MMEHHFNFASEKPRMTHFEPSSSGAHKLFRKDDYHRIDES